MFSQYFTDSFAMIFELVGLMIVLAISVHISSRMKKLTLGVAALLLAESVFYYLERWTQTFETLSIARPLLTACVYSLYPIILFLLMKIMVNKKSTLHDDFIMLLPAILSVPLYLTSQWTKLVCWFDETNHYQGGPLNNWPYFIFGLYALIFLVQNLRFFKTYSAKARVISAYIILCPLLGVLYYLFTDADMDFSPLFASAILLYYIFIYIHTAMIDPLTFLYNRQSYYQDMKQGARTVTGVASVDMNDLKTINDTQGHPAGDEALRTIALILRTFCGAGGVVYRVGGDEFMIFYSGVDEAAITEAIGVMRERLADTPYTCAFGYAMVEAGQTIREAIMVSDQRMYADKAAIKAAAGSNAPASAAGPTGD